MGVRENMQRCIDQAYSDANGGVLKEHDAMAQIVGKIVDEMERIENSIGMKAERTTAQKASDGWSH